MEKRNNQGWVLVLRILGTVALGIITFYGGFLLLLIMAFTSLQNFTVLVIAGIIMTVFVALMWVWGWFKIKGRVIVSLALVVALAAGGTGVALRNAALERKQLLKESLRVTEQIDLALYEPFREGTLAVALDEPSTLQFTEENRPRMDGATAFYPVYAAFARATYPAGQYLYNDWEGPVVCNRTEEAYVRLVIGEADVIFAFGPSDEQLAYAAANDVELNLIPIGYEAFVFFVNDQNSIDNLSDAQVKQIYSGAVTNWSALGGQNEEILAYQRNKNSGSQTALEQIMGNTPIMTAPTERVSGFMGGMISEVSNYYNHGGAIGYTFRFYSTHMVGDPNIKLLSINGVAPTRENIENGSYLYTMPFFAVTAGAPSPDTQALIDWILSAQGQQLIEKTGYTGMGN